MSDCHPNLSVAMSSVGPRGPVGPGVLLRVKVVPGASRSRIVGLLGERVKLTVAAAATGGQANDAARALVASAVGVAGRRVTVVDGLTRPQKTLFVEGLGVQEVSDRLREHLS